MTIQHTTPLTNARVDTWPTGWTMLAYLLVIIIWSTTPLAIKWSAEPGTPFTSIAMRMIIATLFGAGLMLLFGRKLPMHARAWASYAAAFPGIFLALAISYYSSQFLSSGVIAIFYGLGPLISGLMLHAFTRTQSLHPKQWIGISIGFAGLCWLLWPGGDNGAPMVILWLMLLAVSLFSASAILVKRAAANISPIDQTMGGLLICLPAFVALWWWSGEAGWAQMTTRAWAATVYLGIFGSMIGFLAYYFVLSKLSAVTVSLITLITPVNALLLGKLLNQEQLATNLLVASMVILLGLVLYVFSKPASKR